jgi:hypothetical protein
MPRRRARIARVGLVLELPRQEGAVLLREGLGRAHHAAAAFGRRGQDHLGAQRAHQLAALDREGLGHEGDEGIALGRADHGERDAGIAGSRFDHHLAGRQRAALLGVEDDGVRQAILHRGHRIERFDLDEQVDARRRQALDADDRGVADRAQDAVVDHAAVLLCTGKRHCAPDCAIWLTPPAGRCPVRQRLTTAQNSSAVRSVSYTAECASSPFHSLPAAASARLSTVWP